MIQNAAWLSYMNNKSYLWNIFRERGGYESNRSHFKTASNNNQQVRLSLVLGDALTKDTYVIIAQSPLF